MEFMYNQTEEDIVNFNIFSRINSFKNKRILIIPLFIIILFVVVYPLLSSFSRDMKLIICVVLFFMLIYFEELLPFIKRKKILIDIKESKINDGLIGEHFLDFSEDKIK